MALQRAVEGFNYKQLTAANHCSPHFWKHSGLKWSRSWSNVRISVFIATFNVVVVLTAPWFKLLFVT